ncbi:Uncharacterized protein TCM_024716 [Theobroma cacao]|uniref:Uncharacterized protein n=1 Tax=Theobroma cacao TaxID=3641 RepID=A0A061EWW7_THECC|nr:Uncharacterized protein TCM_024716 [Theobroma cacao]
MEMNGLRISTKEVVDVEESSVKCSTRYRSEPGQDKGLAINVQSPIHSYATSGNSLKPHPLVSRRRKSYSALYSPITLNSLHDDDDLELICRHHGWWVEILTPLSVVRNGCMVQLPMMDPWKTLLPPYLIAAFWMRALKAVTILGLTTIPIDSSQDDVAYWTLTPNGEFSTRSAWESYKLCLRACYCAKSAILIIYG